MGILFLSNINKNTAYCLLKGSESGSFGLRSSNQPSKENKVTGAIADNQITNNSITNTYSLITNNYSQITNPCFIDSQ
ncbi:hypothetical protein SAMN04488519_101311 [Algoriphagus ornithinivorans]|uniref:Uncharacterized protein n=1 Tax=Algoriphagus ornithinivorans TaxID=226506 RepID=A0A1I5AXP5_9BACT|nr:hypothetical protein SAMN04488519_101311 [Algoriphagus ornithinivorans]